VLFVPSVLVQVFIFGEFQDESSRYAIVDTVVLEDTGRVVVGGKPFICFLLDWKMGFDTLFIERFAGSWWVTE